MWKQFKTWLGAAALSLVLVSPVSAAIVGGNATGVGGQTAITTGATGDTVDIFINGVYDMVLDLQLETGSPGSGVWANVPYFSDIAPTASTQYRVSYASTAPNQRYRLNVSTDTSGTVYWQVVTGRRTPTVWTESMYSTHYRGWDDFFHGTVPITTTHNGNTPSYKVESGDDAQAVECVILGNPEGVLDCTHGDANTAQDITSVSYGLLTTGALVSTGLTVLEGRLHMSQITATHQGFGLADLITTDAEISFPDVVGITVTEGPITTMQDVAAFVFDTDQTTDEWGIVALNTNSLQNNADVYLLGVAPAVTTYQIFRIEVEATGDCFFYINGTLRGALQTCVKTAAVLIPYFANASTTTTVGTTLIDYIDFWAPRPAS